MCVTESRAWASADPRLPETAPRGRCLIAGTAAGVLSCRAGEADESGGEDVRTLGVECA